MFSKTLFPKTLGFAGVALSLFALPAFGHHSMAQFDQTQTQNLTGTVTEFEWVNPHSWLHLRVMGENGNPENWAITGGSPRNLTYIGWTVDTVRAGDQIEVGFHPARDGSRVGARPTCSTSGRWATSAPRLAAGCAARSR